MGQCVFSESWYPAIPPPLAFFLSVAAFEKREETHGTKLLQTDPSLVEEHMFLQRRRVKHSNISLSTQDAWYHDVQMWIIKWASVRDIPPTYVSMLQTDAALLDQNKLTELPGLFIFLHHGPLSVLNALPIEPGSSKTWRLCWVNILGRITETAVMCPLKLVPAISTKVARNTQVSRIVIR